MTDNNSLDDPFIILRCKKCFGYLVERRHVLRIENPSACNKYRPKGYFLTGLSCWGAGYSGPLEWFEVNERSESRGKITCPHNCGAKLGSWDYKNRTHRDKVFFAEKAVEEYTVPNGQPVKLPDMYSYNPPGYNSFWTG